MDRRTKHFVTIRKALEEVLATKPNTMDFCYQLSRRMITPLPNVATTGRMSGFAFRYRGIAFKGSDLGKRFKWSCLKNELAYLENEHGPFLMEWKRQLDHKGETPLPSCEQLELDFG